MIWWFSWHSQNTLHRMKINQQIIRNEFKSALIQGDDISMNEELYSLHFQHIVHIMK